MKRGLVVGLTLALAACGTSEEKPWRLVTSNEYGFSVLDLDSIRGAGEKKIYQIASWNRDDAMTIYETPYDYDRTTYTIDCSDRSIEANYMEEMLVPGYRLFNPEPMPFSSDLTYFDETPHVRDIGAFICDGVPLKGQSFENIEAFLAWAKPQIEALKAQNSET